MGMRQTPVVSRSMASSPLAGAAPHRMLSAAEVGGPPTGCSGPPGFVSCLAMMREYSEITRACMLGFDGHKWTRRCISVIV